MSQFSALECAHYRRYFDAFATRPGTLAPLELHACLCHFGPIHTIGDILDLIKVHDSSRSGALNFDDFLHLLYEYKQESRTRQQQLEAAMSGIEKRRVVDPSASPSANAIEGISHRELRDILSLDTGAEWKLSAADIDEIVDDLLPTRRNTIITRPFFNTGLASKNMAWLRMRSPATTDIITQTAPMISIRLFGVTSLVELGRTKRRGMQGIAYRSVDAMITVRLDDISVNSTILANQVTPKWDEELQLTIEFPSSSLVDIQRYVESHRLHFDLYDYQMGGVVPHIEWLAGGSIQLETALRSTLSPVMYTITLASPHPCPPVKLEVAIHCAYTSESPLVELFSWPEEEWLLPSGAYRARLESDLALDCHHHHTNDALVVAAGMTISHREAKDKESKAGALLFAEAERFYRSCRIRYRRRHFRLFALDEYNHFRYLPSFITPITLPDPSRTDPELKWTASMLAKNVARIAERSSWHSPLPARAMLQSLLAMSSTGQHTGGALAPSVPGITPAVPIMAAALAAGNDIPASAGPLLHQGLQICSPAAMIMRGYGSELEHSIFLCGCFLGLGLNAFVVLGRDRLSQLRSWVVVITESSLSAPGGGSFRLPPSIVHWNAMTGITMMEDRRGWLTTGESSIDDTRRFDRIGAIMNHTNVWVNAQASDIVATLTWDVQQVSQWTPFISDTDGSTTKRWASSSSASSMTSPFTCWYSAHFLHTIEQLQRISPVVPLQLSHELSRQLAMRISRHRRESLFIVRTFYHQPLSRALEKLISRQKMEVRLMVEPIRRVAGHRRARSSATTRFDAPAANHRHHDSVVTNGKGDGDDEKKKDVNASSVPLLDPIISMAVPERHIWYARAYHFNTDHVGAIFAQLRASGILNTSVPNTTYAIATRVYCYPWGLRSTWVIIGYFYDTLHTLA